MSTRIKLTTNIQYPYNGNLKPGRPGTYTCLYDKDRSRYYNIGNLYGTALSFQLRKLGENLNPGKYTRLPG